MKNFFRLVKNGVTFPCLPDEDARSMEPGRRQYTLEEINRLTLIPYARVMALVVANASWVPVLAFPHRPFSDLAHLHEALSYILRSSDENSKLQVIQQQPDLVDPPPLEDWPDDFQLFECDRAFAARLTLEERAELALVQRAYEAKFDFPLVFEPASHSAQSLLTLMKSRLEQDRETELAAAVEAAVGLALTRLQELIHP